MMQNAMNFITRFFPLWVVLFAVFAFFHPQPVIDLGLKVYVPWFLALIMLGMGFTMSPRDFALVLTRPGLIAIGVVLRCMLMPLIAFAIVHILQLPLGLALGLILVGCCPSGTASNVMTFISRGDTALSIMLTSVITLLAPVLTPLTFYLLAGAYIPIDVFRMFTEIITIVVAPVLAGILLHVVAGRFVTFIQPVVPVISIFAITLTVAIVVALNAHNITGAAFVIFLAVILHNGLGFFFGYWTSRLFRRSEMQSRAITFEIGMENSGLAVTLALAHIDPIAAIPGAIFSVWHNLSGSILAGYWRNHPPGERNRSIFRKSKSCFPARLQSARK